MHEPAAPPAAIRHDRAYPGRPDNLRAVRADLRALLRECPLADEVVLIASELSANATVHSHSREPGATYTLRAEIHPGHYAWIEVQDNGGHWTSPGPDLDRPHGLDIIRSLASDWGIDGDYRTRTVWARVDWPGPAQPADPATADSADRQPTDRPKTTTCPL